MLAALRKQAFLHREAAKVAKKIFIKTFALFASSR
jgi:hypothetical protein